MSDRITAPHVFFALQVLWPRAMCPGLEERLADRVRGAADVLDERGKASFYEGLVDELLAVADQLQYASWEYLDDPGEAEDAYWGWLEGTAQDAREEQPWRYPDDASYAFVTVLVLAPARGLTGRLLDELTDIEDEDGVSADLLDHLLRMLPTLDFPSVTSDVVMVRPGRGGWGVMETQLGDGTYHHLGPVL